TPPVPVPVPVPPSPPAPAPAANESEMDKAARGYVRGLIEATAQGWEAAAAQLEATSTVRDALTKGAQVQYDQRLQALRKNVTPLLGRILAENTEPATPEQRAAVAKAYRDLAASLRSVQP